MFNVLCELPKPIRSSASEDAQHSEYPSATFVDGSLLLVADGHSSLYALRLAADGEANILNSFELKIPAEYETAHASVPFRVHCAGLSSTGSCIAILSSKHYDPAPSFSPEETRTPKKSKYDIWAVVVDLEQMTQDQPIALVIAWHRIGEDVPSQAVYFETKQAFMLLGSSSYHPLATPAPPTYQPAQDELAPIPRAGENLDGAPNAAGPPKPPPYSWTQTDDSVTIAFPLPSSTPKDAIKVTLTPTTLTLLVDDSASADSPAPTPRYALKKLWDGIRTATSFWTLDRQAESTFGLLTFHLDKQHDGTRWAQVFAAAGTHDGEPEVAETLDPSELWLIRESLEKYTAALQNGEDASGLGLGRGMPSLAEGELDDDVDTDIGDMAVLTWVDVDGSEPSWAQAAGADVPFTLLSTPLPGHAASRSSLIMRHGMDGLQFSLDATAWKHTSTFCVLSFVLASKRDTRFVHHIASKAVLAFESGARDLGGNVYIYCPTTRRGDKWAKQAVLKIGDSSSGPLLGVGAVFTKGGGEKIFCLCEKELVVIQSTL